MILKRALTITIFWIAFSTGFQLSRSIDGTLRKDAPPNNESESQGSNLPDLLDAELEELQKGLCDGYFSSVDLTKAYIQRILEVNDRLHTVIEVNPEAESIAAELDIERANGHIRGPLHGTPLLVKDNIATDDHMNTTAGSFGLLGAKYPSDSTVVSMLRAAGAIILGKSNLSQWANFRSVKTTSGWSAYGGQTLGAYCPDQDPGGSSSGSAVASSIGLSFASLGSETFGSLIQPASMNNVVAIRPTVGLTSRMGVIPISKRHDTIGPIARTVKDAAYVLQAIAGKDSADSYTREQPFESPPDYVAAASNYSALKGARIGVPRNLITTDTTSYSVVLNAFADALDLLRDTGAEVIDDLNIFAGAVSQIQDDKSVLLVLGGAFVNDLPEAYLSKLAVNPHNLTSLIDVRKFTQSFKPEEYPDRDTVVWDQILDLGLDSKSLQWWSQYEETLRVVGDQGLSALLSTSHLDALIIPSDYSYQLPSLIGTPVITVPFSSYPQNSVLSKNDQGSLVETGPNIPFGISFLGAKWSEESLIGFAAALEQKTKARSKIKPYLVPRVELEDVMERNLTIPVLSSKGR